MVALLILIFSNNSIYCCQQVLILIMHYKTRKLPNQQLMINKQQIIQLIIWHLINLETFIKLFHINFINQYYLNIPINMQKRYIRLIISQLLRLKKVILMQQLLIIQIKTLRSYKLILSK